MPDYMEKIGSTWVPAQYPYRFADGRKCDHLSMIAETPGALIAAGYRVPIYTPPAAGLAVVTWDAGTEDAQAGTVTFTAATTALLDPGVNIKQLVKALGKTSPPISAAIAAFETANPGVIATILLLALFGYEDMIASLKDLGIPNASLPAKRQIRDLAATEKGA